MISVTGTALNFTSSGSLKTAQERQAALRQSAQEVVGTTFLGEMLKVARSKPFKSKMFHGGRGEEMFQAQLDTELTRRAGGAMKNSLSDAIFKRYSDPASFTTLKNAQSTAAQSTASDAALMTTTEK